MQEDVCKVSKTPEERRELAKVIQGVNTIIHQTQNAPALLLILSTEED